MTMPLRGDTTRRRSRRAAADRVDVVRRVRRQVGRRAADGSGRRLPGRRRPVAARRPRPVRRRRRSTRCPTTSRWCRPPTSSRRSSTTRPTSARSPPPTRAATCSPWAAGSSIAVNVAAFPEHFPPRGDRGDLRGGGHRWSPRPAARSPAATPSATPSRSSGSRCRASCTPTRVFRKAGARPGDVLVLSKPIGTGLTLAGGSDAEKAAAIAGMRTLNRAASEALQTLGAAVHAVTDVTGYGLAGHGWEMAERSGAVGDRRRHRGARHLPGRPRARRRRASHRWRPAQPRLRRRPPRLRRGTPAPRRCASTRRPPAGCSRRSTRRRRRSRSAATAGGVSGEVAAGDPRPRAALIDRAHREADARESRRSGHRPARSSRSCGIAGHDVVVGIDEVGRGAWAGPLMVGAAVLPRDTPGQRRPRLEAAHRTRARARCSTGSPRGAWRGRSVRRSQEECDELGMSAAQKLAARRAIEGLDVRPDVAVDRRQVELRQPARRARRAAR